MADRSLAAGLVAELGLEPVMAVGDIARCYGVSKQAAAAWTGADRWPAVFANAGGSRLWETLDVLEYCSQRGRLPLMPHSDVVAPVAFVEPVGARQRQVVAPSCVQFDQVRGRVQIRVADHDALAFGVTSVWLEGPRELLPSVWTDHETKTVMINGSRSAYFDDKYFGTAELASDVPCDEQALAEAAAASDLSADEVRVTITVAPGTVIVCTDETAQYLVGDTLARLVVDGVDLTLHAGHVGETKLVLGGVSPAQLRRVYGKHLDVFSDGAGRVTIASGDVGDVDVDVAGECSVEYGGRAGRAVLSQDGTGEVAVNHVTDEIVSQRGNVSIFAPPAVDPRLFWAARRRRAGAARPSA